MYASIFKQLKFSFNVSGKLKVNGQRTGLHIMSVFVLYAIKFKFMFITFQILPSKIKSWNSGYLNIKKASMCPHPIGIQL